MVTGLPTLPTPPLPTITNIVSGKTRVSRATLTSPGHVEATSFIGDVWRITSSTNGQTTSTAAGASGKTDEKSAIIHRLVIATVIAVVIIAVIVLLVVLYTHKRRRRGKELISSCTGNGEIGCSVSWTVQERGDVFDNANNHTLELDTYFSDRNSKNAGDEGEDPEFPTYENIEYVDHAKMNDLTNYRGNTGQKLKIKRQKVRGTVGKTKRNILNKIKSRTFPSLKSRALTVAIRQTVRIPANRNNNNTTIVDRSCKSSSANEKDNEPNDDVDDDEYMDMSMQLDKRQSDFCRSLPIKFASKVQIVPKTFSLDSPSASSVYCNLQLSTDVYADMNTVDSSVDRERSDTLQSQKYCTMTRVGPSLVAEENGEGRSVRKTASLFKKRLAHLTFRRRSRTIQNDDTTKTTSLKRNQKLAKLESCRQRTLDAFLFWKSKTEESSP